MASYALPTDIARRHPLHLIELRHNGMALFDDRGAHVLCRIDEVMQVPDSYWGRTKRTL